MLPPDYMNHERHRIHYHDRLQEAQNERSYHETPEAHIKPKWYRSILMTFGRFFILIGHSLKRQARSQAKGVRHEPSHL